MDATIVRVAVPNNQLAEAQLHEGSPVREITWRPVFVMAIELISKNLPKFTWQIS
jgi:hypothetical protein